MCLIVYCEFLEQAFYYESEANLKVIFWKSLKMYQTGSTSCPIIKRKAALCLSINTGLPRNLIKYSIEIEILSLDQMDSRYMVNIWKLLVAIYKIAENFVLTRKKRMCLHFRVHVIYSFRYLLFVNLYSNDLILDLDKKCGINFLALCRNRQTELSNRNNKIT